MVFDKNNHPYLIQLTISETMWCMDWSCWDWLSPPLQSSTPPPCSAPCVPALVSVVTTHRLRVTRATISIMSRPTVLTRLLANLQSIFPTSSSSPPCSSSALRNWSTNYLNTKNSWRDSFLYWSQKQTLIIMWDLCCNAGRPHRLMQKVIKYTLKVSETLYCIKLNIIFSIFPLFSFIQGVSEKTVI